MQIEYTNINIKDLPLPPEASTVKRCGALPTGALERLTAKYGIALVWVEDGDEIPGSFWGEAEAGIIGLTLYVRRDTPVHSALHEFCHLICMDSKRRAVLHTDAGGDFIEEDSVCYLQLLLADELMGMGRSRMMQDMDAWGYSFRLGSTAAWFESDAEDARNWLQQHGLLDQAGQPIYRLRD